MLDLQQLRYFVAVAELESIARAAEQLHISQSPLSRQVIALEARLGLALFTRNGKRLKLNPTGRRYLAECKALLHAAERLESHARDEATGNAGTLDIGYVESAIHAGVLREALRTLKRERPRIRIQLHALRTSAQFDALRRGEIAVGFTHRAPGQDSELWSRLIAEESFLLAVPDDHRLAATARPPGASDLDGEDFVFLSRSASAEGHAHMLTACRQAGFTPALRHQAAEPWVALELVACGLGLAIVQSGLRTLAPPGVRLFPMPSRFPAKLSIHVAAGHAPTPLAAQLLALFPTEAVTSGSSPTPRAKIRKHIVRQ